MKPFRGRAPASRFVICDAEAHHWYHGRDDKPGVLCFCAILYEHGRARATISARSTMDMIARAKRAGWITKDCAWYAHYGGRYDFDLILRDLLPTWKLAHGVFASAFGLWSADLQHRDGTMLCLRDSARLLPGSVASIGESMGLPKIDEDRTRLIELPEPLLMRYCLRDCKIVGDALVKLARLQVGWGTGKGALEGGDTLAARATRTLRKHVVPKDVWNWTPESDVFAATGYYGGRVEPFESVIGWEWEALPLYVPSAHERVHGFDINSSYPYAMTCPLPTEYLGSRTNWDGSSGIIRAVVTVPDMQYPPLPYRPAIGPMKGVLAFPTGTIEGAWTAVELQHAVDCGVTVDRIIQFDAYAVEPWLEPFMRETYKGRRAAKTRGEAGAFDSYAYKILLNSVSGKAIERDSHENWTETFPGLDIDPSRIRERHVRLLDGTVRTIYGITTREPGAFRHAAAGAYITAIGRVMLHRGILATRPAYCDTDAVYTRHQGLFPGVIDAAQLGAWKPEPYDRGEFLAPKLYALWKGGTLTIHAKGFSVRDMDPHEAWRRIKTGEDIERERSASFLQRLGTHRRQGAIAPRRETLTRAYHGATMGKRCALPDGGSRPWHVSEIESAKK